jgi:hypothetical protein
MIDRMWCSIETDRRRSLLKYYYTLFNLLELKGITELLPQVPLFGTRLCLCQRDFICKKACDELERTCNLHERIGEAKARCLQEKAKEPNRTLTPQASLTDNFAHDFVC